MHDIKYIRNNTDAFRQALVKRNHPDVVNNIIEYDELFRDCITKIQSLTTENNKLSKDIGIKFKNLQNKETYDVVRMEIEDIKALVEKNKEQIISIKKTQNQLDISIKEILENIPNILDDSVPDGNNEDDNHVVHTRGEIKSIPNAKEHWELGEAKGYFDFETASKISGSRFVIVKGDLARLERALSQYMLNKQIDNGYVEHNVPVLVNEEAMYGTDKLPKFADQSFKTTDGRWLVPTAEVPLTYMAADTIQPDNFPVRMVALTNCFRSEAGSAGRDTKGILRQHQFQKVEMVSWVKPEDSMDELERMTKCAESILDDLKIPYRRVLLCAGDTGFGSSKTYDLEAWLPGQQAWREISSCSNTKYFQARRMNARFKRDGKTEYFHTLNGSGLAVGRTLIAIMENYQDENGNIHIPDVLKPYMNKEII